jgi:hypothetical protein
MLSRFSPVSTVFDKNMYNFNVQMQVFYSKTMESFLSIIMRNHGSVTLRRKINMAKCPKCGSEAPKMKKSWKMAGRPDKSGKRMQLEIGLYQCPKGHTFREVLSKKKI